MTNLPFNWFSEIKWKHCISLSWPTPYCSLLTVKLSLSILTAIVIWAFTGDCESCSTTGKMGGWNKVWFLIPRASIGDVKWVASFYSEGLWFHRSPLLSSKCSKLQMLEIRNQSRMVQWCFIPSDAGSVDRPEVGVRSPAADGLTAPTAGGKVERR